MKRSLPILLTVVLAIAFLLPISSEAAPIQQSSPPFSGVVLQNSNLRAGPGTNYAIVGSAKAGEVLAIADCNTGCTWYNLSYGEWIAAFLVEPLPDDGTPPPTSPPTIARGIVNTNSNLRAGPGTNYAIVGKATKGTVVQITGTNSSGTWYQLVSSAWIAAFLVTSCDAAYPTVCIPEYPPDLDCPQIPYNNFDVLAPDPHGFDGDNDGLGCEGDSGGGGGPPPTPTKFIPPTPTPTPTDICDSAYPTVCIPKYPPDLDCGEIPYKNFVALPADPHGFDGDNDGVGCES